MSTSGSTSMRRVVVTGMGIASCLGNDLETVTASLRAGRAGIRHLPDAAERGLRSQVGGAVDLDLDAAIDRKLKRFMSDAAAYSYLSLRDAIADAGLDEGAVSHPRTGLIAGSGGGSSRWQVEAADILRERGVRKVGPYMVPRTMCSTVSANLATAFKIKGLSYSISAACATSAHCIGAGADLIRHGAQDIVFAGGGEDLDWTMTVMFDAMGALSTSFNDTPASASAIRYTYSRSTVPSIVRTTSSLTSPPPCAIAWSSSDSASRMLPAAARASSESASGSDAICSFSKMKFK